MLRACEALHDQQPPDSRGKAIFRERSTVKMRIDLALASSSVEISWSNR